MITMHTVKQCPYTGAGTGVLRLSHSVLATFAGAVYDKQEWLALLIGKRSENGMDITVDSLRIPLQERSHASCELVNPEPLTPEIVGVVHSHHNMRAFFSQIDDDTLNPRFPVSIVVAHPSNTNSESESLLGFSYLAEGRVQLPCGDVGVINFVAVPNPLVDNWPANPLPGYSTPNPNITLYHCARVTKSLTGFVHNCTTECGVTSSEKATAIFGRNGKSFLEEVKSSTRSKKHRYQQPYSVVDNRKYFGKGEKGEWGSLTQDDHENWHNWGGRGGY